MTKELEAYNELKAYLFDIQAGTCHSTAMRYTDSYVYLEQNVLNVVEKQLKALDIIKEKRVDVCYFMNCRTLEEYNDDVLASYAYEEVDAEQRMLTQEEYDLLKEELL